jgi:hypothetical protein
MIFSGDYMTNEPGCQEKAGETQEGNLLKTENNNP